MWLNVIEAYIRFLTGKSRVRDHHLTYVSVYKRLIKKRKIWSKRAL